MDKYEVIKYFIDLLDHNYAYHAGDEFPRYGLKVSAARLKELSGSNNRQGEPLIKKIVTDEDEIEQKPKRTTRKRRK